VLVDTARADAGAEPESSSEDGPKQWSPEELQRFEQLAMQAVGYSKERGDQIVVSSAPFLMPDVEFEEEGFSIDPQLLTFGTQSLRILAQLLALVLFARFIVKPSLELVSGGSAAAGPAGMPMSVAALEASLDGAQPELALPPPPQTLTEKVGLEAGARSEDSVTTIRNWLNQE